MKKGLPSIILLGVGAFFTICGITLVALAYGTDYWRVYSVNRKSITNNLTLKLELTRGNPDEGNLFESPIYFNRATGLFQRCYPDEVPKEPMGELKDSLLGAKCEDTYSQYELSEKDKKSFTTYETKQLERTERLRAVFFLYILGMFFASLPPLVLALMGCGCRNRWLIVGAAISIFVGVILLCAAMGVWHSVDDIDMELPVKPYYSSWHPTLQKQTSISFGWSYICSWVGIGLLLIAAALLAVGGYIYRPKKKSVAKHAKNGNGKHANGNYGNGMYQTSESHYAMSPIYSSSTMNSKALMVPNQQSQIQAQSYYGYGYGGYNPYGTIGRNYY